MIARIRKSMEQKDQGFTLIELLVVMIIIGILAAIAIPVFLSQREKARDTSTKADVSTIGKEIAAYYVDGDAQLTATQAGAAGAAITLVDGAATPVVFEPINVSNGTTFVSLDYTLATPVDTGWCVELTNPAGKTDAYGFDAENGLVDGGC